MARPPAGDAGEICNALKGRGILVRFIDHPAMRDKVADHRRYG